MSRTPFSPDRLRDNSQKGTYFDSMGRGQRSLSCGHATTPRFATCEERTRVRACTFSRLSRLRRHAQRTQTAAVKKLLFFFSDAKQPKF